jgi:hypothetical protein
MPFLDHDLYAQAIAALRSGVNRGPTFDLRTPRVQAALDCIEQHIAETWPVEQFRQALEFTNETGRWQNAHAAMNAIERITGQGARLGAGHEGFTSTRKQ